MDEPGWKTDAPMALRWMCSRCISETLGGGLAVERLSSRGTIRPFIYLFARSFSGNGCIACMNHNNDALHLYISNFYFSLYSCSSNYFCAVELFNILTTNGSLTGLELCQ